ncbi:hypothetical protein [Streptomyces sp. NPDC096323]|uniref:hypothetical protein n=1 Tax=Streptomyces sp. NPDC096323 TaxID=3155822 RepID=UPI003333EE68
MAVTVAAAAAMAGAVAPTAAADPLPLVGVGIGHPVREPAAEAGGRTTLGKSDTANQNGVSRTHPGRRLPDTGSRGGEWVIGGIGAALLIAGTAATLVARRTRRRG